MPINSEPRVGDRLLQAVIENLESRDKPLVYKGFGEPSLLAFLLDLRDARRLNDELVAALEALITDTSDITGPCWCNRVGWPKWNVLNQVWDHNSHCDRARLVLALAKGEVS